MKKLKMLTSILLILVLCLSFCMPSVVNAAEVNGPFDITITNKHGLNHTYKAYKIFKGNLSTNTDGGYVLSNIFWGENVTDEAALMEALNGAFSKSWTTAAEVAEYLTTITTTSPEYYAEDLTTFAGIVSAYKGDSVGVGNKTGDGTYKITVQDPGYYLIIDESTEETGNTNDIYSRFMLRVVKDETVTTKSNIPTLGKVVGNAVKTQKADGEEYDYTPAAGMNDHNNTASINDYVPFKITGKFPDLREYAEYSYKIVDTLSAGFNFSNDVSIKIVSEDGNVLHTLNASDYTLTAPDTNGRMEISISDLVASDYNKIEYYDKASIVVEYTAKLTADATTNATANTNTAYLEYSNDPKDETHVGTTVPDTTNTYVFYINLNKVDLADRDKNFVSGSEGEPQHYIPGLEGAEFTLKDSSGTAITTVETNGYGVCLSVAGLANGVYTLEESKAPVGYNELLGAVRFEIKSTIGDDGNLVFEIKPIGEDQVDHSNVTAEVQNDVKNKVVRVDIHEGQIYLVITNSKGAQLPSTGGVGTVIFTVVGLLVMATVVVIAVKSNKK